MTHLIWRMTLWLRWINLCSYTNLVNGGGAVDQMLTQIHKFARFRSRGYTFYVYTICDFVFLGTLQYLSQNGLWWFKDRRNLCFGSEGSKQSSILQLWPVSSRMLAMGKDQIFLKNKQTILFEVFQRFKRRMEPLLLIQAIRLQVQTIIHVNIRMNFTCEILSWI